MKTIHKMKWFVLLMLLIMPATNLTAQNNRSNRSNEPTLADKVAVVNAQCPLEVEDGMILTKMRLHGKYLIMEMNIEPETFNAVVMQIKTNKKALKRQLIQALNGDETFKPVFKDCRKNGKDVSFWFKSTASQKVIKMTCKLKK